MRVTGLGLGAVAVLALRSSFRRAAARRLAPTKLLRRGPAPPAASRVVARRAFVINDSFGHGLRLTGNADYRSVLLDAAESLASRFDDDVGATRSWDFGSFS